MQCAVLDLVLLSPTLYSYSKITLLRPSKHHAKIRCKPKKFFLEGFFTTFSPTTNLHPFASVQHSIICLVGFCLFTTSSPLCLFSSGGAGSTAWHGAASGGGSRVQIRGLFPQRRAGTTHHESPGAMFLDCHTPPSVLCSILGDCFRGVFVDVVGVCCAQDYSWEDHGFSLVNRLLPDMGQVLDERFQVHTLLSLSRIAKNKYTG